MNSRHLKLLSPYEARIMRPVFGDAPISYWLQEKWLDANIDTACPYKASGTPTKLKIHALYGVLRAKVPSNFL
jgi:hypothetical protein